MAKESYTGLGVNYPTTREIAQTISCMQRRGKIETDAEDAGLTIRDEIIDPNADVELEVVTQDMAKWAKRLMDSLTPRQKKIIALQFGLGADYSEPLSQRVIGGKLHISQARVTQLEAEALERMRATAWRQQGEEHTQGFLYEMGLNQRISAIRDSILEPQRSRGRVE